MAFEYDADKLAAMIIGKCEKDAEYAALVFDNFQPDQFPYEAGIVFKAYRDYYNETGEIPVRDVASLVHIKKDDKDDVKGFLKLIDDQKIDNLPESYIKEKTSLFHRRTHLEHLIMDAADVMDKADEFDPVALAQAETTLKNGIELYRPLVESKPQTVTSEMEDFLEHIMKVNERKMVPTYFPQLDEYLNGGLVEKTLSVLIAKTHRRQNCHHVEYGISSIHAGTQRPVCHA